ncbi:DUF5955 family protein [Peterkaempfera bronchialis]|uniref:DUF5955 family protein n=1 Tax=Peterkaempfera bronchialis TaxID=2126346 RepID=UPI003C2FD370
MSEGTPRPPAVNQGVQQSGGTSYTGNQAVGFQAQAVTGSIGFQTPDAAPRMRAAEALDIVAGLLEEHRTALPDAAAAVAQLRRLREELDEEQPEPRVLSRALDRLTAFVQPVTPLVTAVAQLTQAVQGALGH